ncbi:hypothetical protein M1615_03285 [Patescibacteria group bacterium]|nr:hypothetical protein [Patescibacteria group bacterium]
MFDKQKIIDYTEDKHLKDGGYFFAKVEPSSGLDTYYAVKILKMLGMKPQDPLGVKRFFLDMEASEGIDDITGLYLNLETLKEIGYDLTRFRCYESIVKETQNRHGGFGTVGELYVEIASELETTYRAVVISNDLNCSLDKNSLVEFIFSFQNKDGGFGSKGLSLLSTTYYALSILQELGERKKIAKIPNFLLDIERSNFFNFYLEDIFWLTESLQLLKQKPRDTKTIISFLEMCIRIDGGFSRSINLGISTLEDTYYAVTILKRLEEYGIQEFV